MKTERYEANVTVKIDLKGYRLALLLAALNPFSKVLSIEIEQCKVNHEKPESCQAHSNN